METRKCKGCPRELRPNERDYCPNCKNKIDNKRKNALGIIVVITATGFGIKKLVSKILEHKKNNHDTK